MPMDPTIFFKRFNSLHQQSINHSFIQIVIHSFVTDYYSFLYYRLSFIPLLPTIIHSFITNLKLSSTNNVLEKYLECSCFRFIN